MPRIEIYAFNGKTEGEFISSISSPDISMSDVTKWLTTSLKVAKAFEKNYPNRLYAPGEENETK